MTTNLEPLLGDRPATPHAPHWKRPWRAFVRWQRGTTIRRNLLIGGAVIAVGFFLVFTQQGELDRRAREEAAADDARDDYAASLDTYRAAKGAWDLCVETVAGSIKNRGQWVVAVDKIEELGGVAFAADLRNGPLLAGEPRTEAECGDEPERPVTPPELVEG